MKVLFIEPFQLDDSLGGSHKSLYDIILGIKKNDNDVLLASTNRGELTKRLDKYQIATALNNIGYVHLSNKLISFKKHKLVESKVSDEANNSELASKLWILSEEICRSFGFVTFNI